MASTEQWPNDMSALTDLTYGEWLGGPNNDRGALEYEKLIADNLPPDLHTRLLNMTDDQLVTIKITATMIEQLRDYRIGVTKAEDLENYVDIGDE